MKVALIFPPVSTINGEPPSGVSSLSQYLTDEGVSLRSYDLNVEIFFYILDNWETISEKIRDNLEDRLDNKETTRLTKERIQSLLSVTIPLIGKLRKSMDSKILQNKVQEIANVYFFDNLIYGTHDLKEDLNTISLLVNQKIDDPMINDFLGRYFWDDIDLLGFSILSESQFPYTMLIARTLRKKYPHLRFVIGGPFVTEVFRNILPSKAIFNDFDYLVVYEGESALLNIIAHETDGRSINHANVFTSQNCDHTNGPFNIEDLELLSLPDFKSLNLDNYRPFGLSLPIYSSKGCTWRKCAFCNTHHILGYREKKVGHFVEEMINIAHSTEVSRFQLVDEDIPPARLKEISEEILKRATNPLHWTIQTRFHSDLDREVIALAKKAGCYSIEFGLESVSNRIIKKIHKGTSIKIIRRILEDCDAVGMQVILNCMVGFPDENESDAEELIAFLDEIRRRHPKLHIKCNTQIVKIYRNSDFGKNPERYGIEPPIPYELSSAMNWKEPGWVGNFLSKYRDHLLFTSEPPLFLGGLPTILEYKSALGDDPWVSLSKSCIYLEKSTPYRKEEDVFPPYLVKIYYERYRIFRLNDTMEILIDQLTEGNKHLSKLKNDFLSSYPEMPEEAVLKVLADGLHTLNEFGAITFYKERDKSICIG